MFQLDVHSLAFFNNIVPARVQKTKTHTSAEVFICMDLWMYGYMDPASQSSRGLGSCHRLLFSANKAPFEISNHPVVYDTAVGAVFRGPKAPFEILCLLCSTFGHFGTRAFLDRGLFGPGPMRPPGRWVGQWAALLPVGAAPSKESMFRNLT